MSDDKKAARRTRADCTVRALATAAGISYEQAEQIARDAGRKNGRGFTSPKLIATAKRKGIVFHKLRFRRKTLTTFLRTHPVGRFYLYKRRHALAVIDGITDGTPHGSIILSAWQHVATGKEKS